MNHFKKLIFPVTCNNYYKTIFLFIATIAIILVALNSNELWTMESRWAAVCLQMLLRHDYLHPHIYSGPYYDKPLLSYWLIILFSKIFTFNEWALRLPSALAGISAVYCTYKIGDKLFNRNTGIIAGWLLISNYFFVTWSRTASADLLNIAGIMLAILWYVTHKDKPSFINYLIFFAITAITSLFKGLLGFTLPSLVVLIDIVLNKSWQKHFNLRIIAAFIIGSIIYMIPFILSAYSGTQNISGGLSEVFRENFLRFVAPFDHKNPIYTYLIYLPIYTLPCGILFIPALFHSFFKWKNLDNNWHWIVCSLIALFLFFTASGSRRSYYVLPLVPFAALIAAVWIQHIWREQLKKWLQKIVLVFYGLLFIWFAFIQPHYNQRNSGIWLFATNVRHIAETTQPWNNYKILVLNGGDNKAVFYLKPQQEVHGMDTETFLKMNNKHKLDQSTIITARERDLAKLQLSTLNNYKIIHEDDPSPESPIALIKKSIPTPITHKHSFGRYCKFAKM